MFGDNKDFYPTPAPMIEKMLASLNFKFIHSILEPSAGKGDIAAALMKKADRYHRTWYGNGNSATIDLDCIELDSNLRHILKGNNFRVVHDDFLTYETMKEYDLIIMNPPFSNGCKHLLKALEMQSRNGGRVICLLNAETLRNPYSNERMQLVRLLDEYHADIQYISDAFVYAERETQVETALISVKLPSVNRSSFILNELKRAMEHREYASNVENTQVAENDFLKVIVKQYQLEAAAGIQLIKEFYAMQPSIMNQFKKDENGNVVQTGGSILRLSIEKNDASVNAYLREIRGKYWTALFENPKFVGRLTANLQREYYNKIQELKDYDFSLYNIYEIKIDMNKKVVQGVKDTIVSLFDELSHKYSYYDETSNNIHYYDGWKTNKAWIINKKVIIPLSGWKNMAYSFGGYRPTDYDVINKLSDIEKCLNYLDGGLTESLDLRSALEAAEKSEQSRDVKLKYFKVTFYKKGTCHITFTNEELLKKFNIFGSQSKGWLPPSYGKKKYNQMAAEEKTVVDAFEGESAYNKVMCNTNYYLADVNSMLMLDMAE